MLSPKFDPHSRITVTPSPPKPPARSGPSDEQLQKLEHEVSQLRREVFHLQHQLVCLEQLNKTLGDSALTMPEDLGDWDNANPRISGLVRRIYQTYELSKQLQDLRTRKNEGGAGDV